jgi:hypothetical protein
MRIAALLALLLLPACLGSAAANHAADVAAQQHGCPRSRVRVLRRGGDWTYWLSVCGRERLYDTRDGRYVDITGTLR